MIRVENLSITIDAFQINSLNLEVEKGQYFVLLGPPGSGKTVLLGCICGLRRIDSGKIYINNRDVTAVEPRARGIGYVPQDYALFPHLSVEGNIGFALRQTGCNRRQIRQKVAETAQMLGIENLLTRSVINLSGGEKQRTALARAIITEPQILLLDEPVCALDENTRRQICSLLHTIQRRLNLTTIHISHSVEEAFSVADFAGILKDGCIRQIATVSQLLRKPDSEFVARFMGCDNIFNADVTSSDTTAGKTTVKLANTELSLNGLYEGSVKFMIRPENILVRAGGQHRQDEQNSFTAELTRWRDYGSYVRIELNANINLTANITAPNFKQLNPQPGTTVSVTLKPENIHILTGQCE